ncbi:DUF4062 domain-containing protein [candidate division KSB1 bacterium]|nr:DUF4062 domain-containing protein [candidate division KSB1 bacterium]
MKIFVSSTYEDLKEYRDAVRDAIISRRYEPIMMEYFIPEGDPPKDECLRRIRESDIVIAIYAFRYGRVLEGDKISITEQEYELAKKKKKKIFFFMPHKDLEKKWPSEHREDREELRHFRGKILRDHYVQFFKNEDDLKFLVAKTLPRDVKSDIQKALEDARDEAKAVSHEDRLDIIDDLVEENNKGLLKGEGLRLSTKLIASDFASFDESIKPTFIYATAELLTNNLKSTDYVKIANRYTRNKRFWRQIHKALLPAFIFLLIGLIAGILSYRFNWGGVRSKYLAGKNANPMDVVEWLSEEKVGENINFDDVSSPGTTKAIVGLSFAYELDPRNKELRSNLEKLLRDVRRDMRQKKTAPERLQNDLIVLNKIYEYIPYQGIWIIADSLKPQVDLIELEQQLQNPAISDSEILQGYTNLWRDHRKNIDSTLVKQKMLSLQEAVSNFEQNKAAQASDTVTISQQLLRWQDFINRHRLSPEKNYAQNELERITNLIAEYASISDDGKFATCRSIADLTPQGKSNRFSPGNICAWAQVHAPRNELVYFKWYANGELLHTFSVRVDHNLEPGYRVHSAKNYSSEYSGKQEVRLYNSQNQLIGRRVFYVG